jgi:hypothetical protein
MTTVHVAHPLYYKDGLPYEVDMVGREPDVYAVTLLLMRRALGVGEQSVRKEELLWYLDLAEEHGDPLQVSAVFSTVYGPRSRRGVLNRTIGELAGAEYLTMSIHGYTLTEDGAVLAEQLASGPYAPYFANAEIVTSIPTRF